MLVAGSTIQAQRRLKNQCLQILVDNSVIGHSITHETAWISTGPKTWGDVEVNTGYAARVGVYGPQSSSEIFQNVTFLPGLVHLVRKGRATFFTSSELQEELVRQPTGRFRGYGSCDYSLMSQLQMESVDGHALSAMASGIMGLPNVKDAQQARLAHYNDPLYLALRQRLGQKNDLDAWHICTAERHNMYCFLTMDLKLKRMIQASAHLEPFRSLKTRILTPADLGEELALVPINPALFGYHDASWFVRADLHWPENKRKRPKSRRTRQGN